MMRGLQNSVYQNITSIVFFVLPRWSSLVLSSNSRESRHFSKKWQITTNLCFGRLLFSHMLSLSSTGLIQKRSSSQKEGTKLSALNYLEDVTSRILRDLVLTYQGYRFRRLARKQQLFQTLYN